MTCGHSWEFCPQTLFAPVWGQGPPAQTRDLILYNRSTGCLLWTRLPALEETGEWNMDTLWPARGGERSVSSQDTFSQAFISLHHLWLPWRLFLRLVLIRSFFFLGDLAIFFSFLSLSCLVIFSETSFWVCSLIHRFLLLSLFLLSLNILLIFLNWICSSLTFKLIF